MAKKSNKNGKSGAGKFFLGALLGGVAGALAGKFIKISKDDGEEIDEEAMAPVEKTEKKSKSAKTTKK